MLFPLKIAVDFDGTIVEHRYPKIGKEIPFAIETLLALQQKGHKLILWTCRTGIELEKAIEFCAKKGLHFYSINRSYPEEDFNGLTSRKIDADIYIDNSNLGGIPPWKQIYKTFYPDSTKKFNSWQFLLSKFKH